jgi:hypothetical protein
MPSTPNPQRWRHPSCFMCFACMCSANPWSVWCLRTLLQHVVAVVALQKYLALLLPCDGRVCSMGPWKRPSKSVPAGVLQ